MLKQLKLQSELKQRKAELEALQKRKAEFDSNTESLTVALEEAQTDEDIQLVSNQVTELEARLKRNP